MIKRMAVSAYMLVSTGNIVGLAVHTGVRPFEAFEKAAGASSGDLLMAFYFCLPDAQV